MTAPKSIFALQIFLNIWNSNFLGYKIHGEWNIYLSALARTARKFRDKFTVAFRNYATKISKNYMIKPHARCF